MIHPIDDIVWIDAESLNANDYNPNIVYTQELRLLEHSLLTTGWLQPILVTQDRVIIDGFHRTMLAKTSPKVKALTGGKVPCSVLTLTEPERMMLTVRITRAKGSHIALKMHDLVTTLVQDHGMSVEAICKGIGATKDEVELLLMENVFKKLNVADHKYSKAWYPANSAQAKQEPANDAA